MLSTNMQLALAAAMTVATIMLSLRKLRQQNSLTPAAVGTFRLVWEFIFGLAMLTISCWLAVVHTPVIHMSGAIVGLIGCVALIIAWNKMNRAPTLEVKPRVSQSMRISEIKHSKKK